MRFVLLFLPILALAACGPRVNGEIAVACMEGGRDAANARLCSCVQQVAGQTLRRSDQARLVEFFRDPEVANDVKISDTRAADAFWDRYRDFTRAAERSCRR